MEEVLKIINPMTSTVFWSIIVFIILLVVIWRFVLKPVNRMLTKRQDDIAEAVNSAERQKDEALKYLDLQKAQLDEAKNQARQIIEDSKAAAKKVKDEIEEKANEKSRSILETAVEEIKAERERSIAAVKNQIVDIALEATEKIISKNLTEEEHKRLIEESLKEVQKI
ncbi:MAG: F0F1 ATP synthase subunit B [Actinobacteria bacterium]|nr:F0F1 ATP synthase subunit B [Actinomycetota bacterium]